MVSPAPTRDPEPGVMVGLRMKVEVQSMKGPGSVCALGHLHTLQRS